MSRRLLYTAAAVGVATVAGFALGHADSKAASAPRSHSGAHVASTTAPSLPAVITVPSEELANLHLHFGTAKTGPLVRSVSVTGTVGYDQLRVARITPPASGRIEALDVVVGDQVTANQRLAVLDNFELSTVRSKLAGAKASVAQAKAQLVTAKAAFRRAKSLVHAGGMAQSQLDARRAAVASMQADLRTREAERQQYQDEETRLMPTGGAASSLNRGDPTGRHPMDDVGPADSEGAIVAPFKGVVDSVTAARGEIVNQSTRMFVIADLSKVWVQADVPEADLGSVHIGDAVQVRVSAYPDRVFTGHVAYIADKLDPMTGTAKVRCIVPNPDDDLRINMFAKIRIISPLGRSGVLVSSSALQTIDNRRVVFVPTGQRHFSWRRIRTGFSGNGKTQVTSGLAGGTHIVTDGSYWLKAMLMQSTIPDEG